MCPLPAPIQLLRTPNFGDVSQIIVFFPKFRGCFPINYITSQTLGLIPN
jgi:hypothetical protein